MSRAAAWLAAAALLAVAPLPARAADACAGLNGYRAMPATELRVAKPAIRNDLPMTVLKGQRGRGEALLMGKIHVEKVFRHETNFTLYKAPKGRGLCVALDKVAVTVELTPITIFIAERSKPGSCEYEVTLRHERKHLKYEQEAMAAALRKLEGRIRDTRKPFAARNEKDARARAEKLVGGWVEAAIKNAAQDAERNHIRLDSLNNSKREADECN